MRIVKVKQIELQKYNHMAIHEFPFPEFRDVGFYRLMTSYSAFFESKYRRNWSNKYLFTIMDDRYPDCRTDFEKSRDSSLPHVKHENLLAFFDAIGYNRKTKRIE